MFFGMAPVGTRKSKTTHDKLVSAAVKDVETKGHTNIKADHIGYKNGAPVAIGGHVPDVTTATVLIEAETADSINDQHTADQLRAFAGSSKTRYLAVPYNSVTDAEKMLTRINLSGVFQVIYYNV